MQLLSIDCKKIWFIKKYCKDKLKTINEFNIYYPNEHYFYHRYKNRLSKCAKVNRLKIEASLIYTMGNRQLFQLINLKYEEYVSVKNKQYKSSQNDECDDKINLIKLDIKNDLIKFQI